MIDMAKLKEGEKASKKLAKTAPDETEEKKVITRKPRTKAVPPEKPETTVKEAKPVKVTRPRRSKTIASPLPQQAVESSEAAVRSVDDESKVLQEAALPPDPIPVQSEPAPSLSPPVVTVSAPAPETYSPPIPKHSYGYLASQTLIDLRKIGKELNVSGATTFRKDDLIISVLKARLRA